MADKSKLFSIVDSLPLDEIQSQIRYTFNDPHQLVKSLVHRSYINEKDHDPEITEHNERLEFLGDAVLELVVTDYLYDKLFVTEGVMTSLRSSLVNYKIIGEVGQKLGLDTVILLSRGEKEELGKARLSIVADCVEAVIGAIYKDGGIEPCIEFIHHFIIVSLPDIISNQTYKDPKTIMQEFCQKYTKITPHYRVISTEGKDHEKTFTIGLWIGVEKISEGVGRSKQDAETEAAQAGLEVMKAKYEGGVT